ncbi:unnamed protein product [Cuscuta epithymum]|uniref:Uncharacterized protein n=1 Tax=Cuscuta epithymum TaxID=186058 RepID=A0AAV0F8C6_9ASTE|nr:unnamed protein product [Cuscuta epithymum]CAH9131794.1 unnamed protein product [Cuscuta epithymum]
MMKSTLIKDFYGEIERLKSEVYAAREKNGIYIPKERYYQEESERIKVVLKHILVGKILLLKHILKGCSLPTHKVQEFCTFLIISPFEILNNILPKPISLILNKFILL